MVMPIMPDKKIDKLGFCEAHVEPWTDNAVPMGSSAPAVADFSTKTTAARAAYTVKQAAEEALRNANNDFNMALAAATTAAADIIKQVRAKAATSGNSIYTLASLPIPATPGPVPPPGTPTDLKVELNPDGSLKLSWKCANPAGSTGTLYHVYRSTTGEAGDYTFVGGTGERKFPDGTVPSGLSIVYYKIQAVRTTALGVAGEFMVRFGVGGAGAGGAGAISVTAIKPGAGAAKMAA
jgi:hypothetical protein